VRRGSLEQLFDGLAHPRYNPPIASQREVNIEIEGLSLIAGSNSKSEGVER
jgi:hypothetical protein